MLGSVIHLSAQVFDIGKNKYAFDGNVQAIAHDQDGNTYIGGSFTFVGDWSGAGVEINTITSEYNNDFPKVDWTVYAVVSIPSGGWFIGGDFNHIDGIERNNLARINADGSIHPFSPNMNSHVRSLALDGIGNLYAGVFFSK